MPAVLVHGVPDTHRLWNRLLSQIKRQDVIAPDLPGFGKPVPDGFTATKEEYIDWLTRELEAIGTPVDLVGHDWGCLLTARIASTRPDLVRTWVGISGPVDPAYPWHDLAKIWQTPVEGERWMENLDLEAFADQLVQAKVPRDEAREMVRYIDETMKSSILALYRSAVHVGAEWKPELSNITVPALVIWGLDDPYLPHRFADELANATRAQAAVKLRSSHWPMLERTTDVARELEAHWAQV
ncbi:alpha/beta hydrolase [Achromobacter spanius]|uniref:alpha/beta fold hydrolase n=1 Tax=Achromobacter spanius TaxID=217203 RepID=UPI000F8FAC29|nr:alpha/beta hydrolase [Achromobacter spanius]AZS80058.1 alpha/beta hydrolase [Achromobacter spanius]